MRERKREREGGREKERQTDRQRQTDRHSDKRTDTLACEWHMIRSIRGGMLLHVDNWIPVCFGLNTCHIQFEMCT